MGEIRNKRYNQMIEAKCHIYHFHLSQLIGICKTQLGIDDQVLVKLVKNPGYHSPYQQRVVAWLGSTSCH